MRSKPAPILWNARFFIHFERTRFSASNYIVLVWLMPEVTDRGVILGRIGQSHASPDEPCNGNENMPEELVIEAKKNLTLKCGEGSIAIREDGQILIKGKDLVSHAKRMNRIKGGSVSIN